MSNLHKCILLNCLLLLPLSANGAGTYYTSSGYQPAQSRYGQSASYASLPQYNRANTTANVSNTGTGVRYSVGNNSQSGGRTTGEQRASVNQSQQKSSAQKSNKNGFFLGGGITHENALWKFEMKNTAKSVLSYNNLAWNVLGLNGGYVFDAGSVKMQIDAGFKYGMQWGEASMIDDDISGGGYGYAEFWQGDTLIGSVVGHGLSVGASKDGSMIGFNVGFGLTDFWRWGNMKITPSIGYRYLKYKLETKKNYGMLMDTVSGIDGCSSSDGESQCGVALYFYENRDDAVPAAILPANYLLQISGLDGWYIDASDTYYYEQSGVSHSYDVTWSGPYLALDMLYDINQNNSVNGRIELGFPGYNAIGDQPYRWDWEHPKGVEDNANMFSALHLGVAFDWRTAISNSVSLSLGMTYDYYTISGADTTTYLNKSWYDKLVASGSTEPDVLWYKAQLEAKRDACGGWTCKSSNEIDSVYRSMGIRVGVDAKF